ncbi:microcephalin isoform X7 [Mus musculus]|uniref:microcephalin isoform X7 n=1 Tax=Mus musculus TaxID=10090 RepID=UPI0005AB9910|nr:microcephalin isoform X7 [Mus musculus]|eukprot:XP_011240361.1 PREDICTED: microcephalin isoform X6 [Mus musculus]
MEASGGVGGAFLKDVVAYVEVWSSKGTENYSRTFAKQLEDMGATVSKTLNKQVTHVIFKDGYQSTWDKAQKTGAKLVSVLWVEKCRMAGALVDESLFPAVNTDEHLPNLSRKKHKCMQPKDFILKTPENDKRLQKKFEKMAEELQRQKAALDDDVPVLLFESPRSLVYSSPVNVMKRRLQDMKEKRENLSPTCKWLQCRMKRMSAGELQKKGYLISTLASQMLEQSQQNPCVSLFETSLNISHQPLSSDESFASGSHSSFGDSCGDQERKLGRSANEMTTVTCPSSPVLRASSFYGSASPNHLRQPRPQKAPDSPSKESINCQKDATGAVADSERKQAAGVSQGVPDEKLCLSPTMSIIEEHQVRLGPKNSSAKRKRAADLGSSPKGKLKKRYKRKSALAIQLFKSDQSPPSTIRLIPGTPDVEASSYEDYFSPDNLKERNSERLPPEAQQLASPSLFHCRGLSKWERRNMLEMCDFTCIGEKHRSISSISDLISKSASSLEKPVKEEVNTASTCLLLVETSANDSPGLCSQPGPQLRDDTGPEGSSHPDTLSSSAHHITPLKGNSTETRDPGDGKGSPKEGSTPPASASPEDEVHICNLSLGEDCNVEKSVEEKENIATGYSESVKNGPGRPDPSDSSCTGLVRPQQKPKKSEKEEKAGGFASVRSGVSPQGSVLQYITGVDSQFKSCSFLQPTRTLVMTSMPSEKQTLIIQVVSTLKGFSFAPEVCETTTHVLVGKSARTLNVLMGIARGCWILSYEWVLLSLELGHWISEEPFELSETFPAAPFLQRTIVFTESVIKVPPKTLTGDSIVCL